MLGLRDSGSGCRGVLLGLQMISSVGSEALGVLSSVVLSNEG